MQPVTTDQTTATVCVMAEIAAKAVTNTTVTVTTISFKDFYTTHHDRLSRALSLYFGSEDLGAEAADEAFTRAYERWQTISQHPNPYGWVYVVGTNRARSVLRRRVLARNKQALLEPGISNNRSTDEQADIDTKAAVTGLRPAFRSVVIARFYLGMSVVDTAAALKVKPGTVKSRLSRALDQLRTELGTSR